MKDSLIKWRKKCCGTVFSVLMLLFCVRARECARGGCSGTFSVPLPSFSGTKIYVAFFSLPIFFYFTLELPQYQKHRPQLLRPSKSSPLVEVKVACPLHCVFEWIHVCFQLLNMGSHFHKCPAATKEMPELFWGEMLSELMVRFFFIFYKCNVLSNLNL